MASGTWAPHSPSSITERYRDLLKQKALNYETPGLERSGSKNTTALYNYADAKECVKDLMKQRAGSPLKAWIKFFDRNLNGLCGISEFRLGMKSLKYQGKCELLWEELDEDKLDLITLEAIEPAEAKLWSSFRKWSGQRFANPRDMVHQIRNASGAPGISDGMIEEEFVLGSQNSGWEFGFESLLFKAMDVDDEGCLSQRELRWLELEVKRRDAKNAAKDRFIKESHARAAAKVACQNALQDFKMFLRRSFGSTYHAWRRALDSDGTMNIQRVELFKTCRQLNWKGDVRALWRALDFNNSGLTTLEELDPHCAQLLAQFRTWAVGFFGAKPSAGLWTALDHRNRRKLSPHQFINELRRLGFETKPKTLTKWLDWQPKRYLVEEDLLLLDKWKPPAWLIAEKNFDAAEEMRQLMKGKYGSYLKAWRSVMDKDNSNNCNWHEFTQAAKSLKFHGDVPGAWLALDEDVSGSISLGEIDKDANVVLMEFKQWSIEEFGSVRSAFKTMDVDSSNELTCKEFKLAMREYEYPGDANFLFEILDYSGEKRLNYKEVTFLDAWDIPDMDAMPHMSEDMDLSIEQSTKPTRDGVSILLEYKGEGPGPGAYTVSSGFGAAPMMPTARHGGAFSFTGRSKGAAQDWLRPAKLAPTVGPTNYDPLPEGGPSQKRKPAWSFGSTAGRAPTPRDETRSPGPGAYEAKNAFHGPQFSMGHRWGVTVHPLQRPSGGAGGASRRRGYQPHACEMLKAVDVVG